jgi:cytochrome c oxidase assembly factor CtaG
VSTSRILTELWDWRSPVWLLATAALTAYLWTALRARHGSGRLHRLGAFAMALAALLLALVSPLAALAERTLFSAHMAQHLLLLLLVPLLTLLAWPRRQQGQQGPAGAAGQTPSLVRRLAPLGWIAGIGAMWFWHVPVLCSASQTSRTVFTLQAVSLLAAGTAFWWPIFSPREAHRLPPHQAGAYLFTGCLGCTLLGIYLTFSPLSVCPVYTHAADPLGLLAVVRGEWGLDPAADQQLGGLLMWVPACTIYLSAILAVTARWYRGDRFPVTA